MKPKLPQVNKQQWALMATELKRVIAERQMGYSDLAAFAGISRASAFRMLNSGLKNRTQNSLKAYASLIGSVEKVGKTEKDLLQDKIFKTVAEYWDGTQPHAELICELITSTRDFEISARL